MADQAIQLAIETGAHNPQPWHLLPHERSGHVLVVGSTGPANRALLWNMMVQDIEAGAGVCVIDVTGQYAQPLLDAVPASRANQTYIFQPQSRDTVVGFNPFEDVPLDARPRAAQDIMELFRVIWDLDYDRTPLLLDLLRSSARVLLDSDEGTLLSLYAMLTNAEYRQRLVCQCQDPLTRKFWADFENWDERDQRDKPQPVLTRLRAFLSDPQLRNVLGQVRGTLDLNRVVTGRQVLIGDFSRHELGVETAKLFGCLLLTSLQTVLAGRTGGWPFYVYLPEAHHIHIALATRALSSPAKSGGVVASVDQVAGYQTEYRTGFLSAERLVSFRLGPDDARLIAGRFGLAQAETALTTMSQNRLAISDTKYEWQALPTIAARHNARDHITRRSKQVLGISRQKVEAKIERFLENL